MEYKLLRTKCTQPKTVRLETWNKSLVSHLRPRGEPGSCFSPGEVINLNLGVSTFENARWNMEEQRTSTQSWERSQRLYRIHCEGSVMYVRMSLMCQFNSGCVHNTILIPPLLPSRVKILLDLERPCGVRSALRLLKCERGKGFWKIHDKQHTVSWCSPQDWQLYYTAQYKRQNVISK